MMAMETSASAPVARYENWNAIQWRPIEQHVRRLQMRIAKAYREKRHGKVKALQWILTHSYQAKLLAVRRVTKNQGAKTARIHNLAIEKDLYSQKAERKTAATFNSSHEVSCDASVILVSTRAHSRNDSG